MLLRVLQRFSRNEKIFVVTERQGKVPMSAQAAVNTSMEPIEDGFLELSDQELYVLVDTNARELLGISGEEFLRRLRARDPLKDDMGRPVPAWEPVAMIAHLLDE